MAYAFNPNTPKADGDICEQGIQLGSPTPILNTAPFHCSTYHCVHFYFSHVCQEERIQEARKYFIDNQGYSRKRGKHTGLQTKTQQPVMVIWARSTAPWGPHILPPVDTQDWASKGGGRSSGVPECERICDASL